jgi:hypothetical protein
MLDTSSLTLIHCKCRHNTAGSFNGSRGNLTELQEEEEEEVGLSSKRSGSAARRHARASAPFQSTTSGSAIPAAAAAAATSAAGVVQGETCGGVESVEIQLVHAINELCLASVGVGELKRAETNSPMNDVGVATGGRSRTDSNGKARRPVSAVRYSCLHCNVCPRGYYFFPSRCPADA